MMHNNYPRSCRDFTMYFVHFGSEVEVNSCLTKTAGGFELVYAEIKSQKRVKSSPTGTGRNDRPHRSLYGSVNGHYMTHPRVC